MWFGVHHWGGRLAGIFSSNSMSNRVLDLSLNSHRDGCGSRNWDRDGCRSRNQDRDGYESGNWGRDKKVLLHGGVSGRGDFCGPSSWQEVTGLDGPMVNSSEGAWDKEMEIALALPLNLNDSAQEMISMTMCFLVA